MPEPLAAFPDVDHGDRALVARHQRTVRSIPDISVADLVYEYRTQFHRDPLVDRDETAYYLSVRPHVWAEFAERMDLGDAELSRLKAAHEDQFAASVGTPPENEAMILTRE